MGIVKSCANCGNNFEELKKSQQRKYCSHVCYSQKRSTLLLKECSICKKSFKFLPTLIIQPKYCSRKCFWIGKTTSTTKFCLQCKKEMKVSVCALNIKKHCSKKCYTKTQTGKTVPRFWAKATEKEKIERVREKYEKYVIRNEKRCWGWKAFYKKYPAIVSGEHGKTTSAHRISWLLHYGEIPKERWVLHRCDNPPCTRPDHLFLGTPRDNVIDMFSKGRRVILKGEETFSAKLTDEDVINIKKLIQKGVHYATIASIYNISLSAIYDIKDGRTWNHLT